MTYPGNPSISPEVQKRIRSTFEQTLGLAERGSHQEAALGCDFVLQLDPEFQPARTLAERLRQSDGAVPVDDLRDLLAGRPSPAERKAEADALFSEHTDPGLDGGFDLGEAVADLDAELPEIGAPADAVGASEGDVKDLMEDLFDQRRYEELVALAREHTERIAGDARLAHMASTAAARQEAAPYVERFLSAARRAQEKGDDAEAAALLDKARALDASHPGIAAAEDSAPPELPATPAPPPPLATPAEPVDAEPVDAEPTVDPFADEGDPRIAELLAEGQTAFERGDHQSAIDAWSRIFLIDIDHDEASRRIEEARRLKSEQERRIEEAYHDALNHLEAGRVDEARSGFRQVLELSPGHLAAQEQLGRIEPGRAAVRGRSEPATAAAATPPVPRAEPDPEPLKEEIMVPPDPGSEAAVGSETAPGYGAGGSRPDAPRRFVLIGSVVLVLVLVGAYVVWQQWDRFFPNAEDATAEQPAAVDPISRAMRLHESGRTAMAINQLRRLPPSSPQYEEAQALISQWEAAVEPAGDPGEGDEVASATDRSRQGELIAEAEAAVAAGENLRARSLLMEAEGLGVLPPDGDALLVGTAEALAPLSRFIDMMAQGEHERALPELWQLHDENPDDPDVRRLIADAYYNLATRSLLQGDADVALDHLREIERIDPGNGEVERLARFAETYSQREKDLLYRIYVKYLPPRE